MRPATVPGDRINDEREKLQLLLAQRIRSSMASLVENSGSVGHHPTADLLLVAADGRKLAAHMCILRQRAPVFFSRYIQPTLDATPRGRPPQQLGALMEIAIGDVDSAGLEFFIRSVYTDEEVQELSRPSSQLTADRSGSGGGYGGGGGGGRTGNAEPFTNKLRTVQAHAPAPLGRQSSPDSLNARGNGGLESEWNLGRLKIGGSTTDDCEDGSAGAGLGRSQAGTPTMRMTTFKAIASQNQLAATAPNSATLPRFSGSGGGGVQATPGGRASPSIAKPGGAVQANKAIFSMFIGIDDDQPLPSPLEEEDEGRDVMSKSFPRHNPHYNFPLLQSMSSSFAGSTSSIRSRILAARKLSMQSSVSSLTSIDASPSDSALLLDSTSPYMICPSDRNPPSQLASDLLRMYLSGEDCDCTIVVDDGELRAHHCILWASCPQLRAQLQQQNPGYASNNFLELKLKGYDKAHVHFLLSFLYGGLTCITDEVDVWEVLRIAAELDVEGLTEAVLLHLRVYKFHCYHRPCAGCVSAAFDLLPRLRSSPAAEVQALCNEVLAWQAQNFHRVWKSRVFLHLTRSLQKECFNALLESVTEGNVIEVLLGCEKLQVALSRVKLQQHAQAVQTLVADVGEYCTEFLVSSLDLLIQSESFSVSGRDLALNLPFLEDILPPLVHALSADVAVKTYLNLHSLVRRIASGHDQSMGAERSGVDGAQWNPRFLRLCRRLYELCDRHLLHYAASVVKCDAWPLLDKWNQTRVLEAGIFVEMKLPRAPLPNFSSLHRPYNRSLSAGLHSKCDRTRSLERTPEGHTPQPPLRQQQPVNEVVLERDEPLLLAPTKEAPASNDAAIRDSSTAESAEESAAPPPQSRIPSLSHVGNTNGSTAGTEPMRTRVDNRTKRAARKRTPVGARRAQASRLVTSDDSASLQRQNTHTVMTAQQNKEAGIQAVEMAIPKKEGSSPVTAAPPPARPVPPNNVAQMPRPMATAIATPSTPVASKPRSVVRPMPKAVDVKLVAAPTNMPLAHQSSVADASPRASRSKLAPKSSQSNAKLTSTQKNTKIPMRPTALPRMASSQNTSQRGTGGHEGTGRKSGSGQNLISTPRRSAIKTPLRASGASKHSS